MVSDNAAIDENVGQLEKFFNFRVLGFLLNIRSVQGHRDLVSSAKSQSFGRRIRPYVRKLEKFGYYQFLDLSP